MTKPRIQPPSGSRRTANRNLLLAVCRYSSLGAGTLLAFAALRERRGPRRGLFGLLSAGLLAHFFTGGSREQPQPIHLRNSIRIDCQANRVYEFWRSLENLPQVMSFLDQVETRSGGVTHWTAKAPIGPAVQWTSEIVEDIPDRKLSWRSLPGSDLHNRGSVEFTPREEGHATDLRVELFFEPPGHEVGAALGHFLGSLENALLSKSLHQLKAHLETGETPTGNHYRSWGGL